MNWKLENIKARYIDEITPEEAHVLAFTAAGKPDNFELLKIEAECNGNNIPHVKIHYSYFEHTILETVETYIGIFERLDAYHGKGYMSIYCQREFHDLLKTMNF